MNPLLHVAVKAARRAGKTILRYRERLDQVLVTQKGRNDFVSQVDRMAEADIIDTIQAHYPSHAIVTAERDAQLSADPAQAECEWIIDPLDGTLNYLHSNPQFAVAIAARQQGQLQHAVIFDPLRDELYSASRGQGAHLNNRRIRVTQQSQLARALLATGFSYQNPAALDPWLRHFKTLLLRAADIRRGGSAALELAYVACGRLDGYWQSGLAPWEIAAGSLLVREAGGLTADFQGQQDFLHNGQVVAANQMIFNHLMVILATQPESESRHG